MQIAAVEQRLHQHRHAADIVQILVDIAAAGLQIGDIGRALEDLGDVVQVESMPASCAIAGRCSAALVEPPDAATTMAAFSSALRVTMSRGRMPLAQQLHHRLADCLGVAVAAS